MRGLGRWMLLATVAAVACGGRATTSGLEGESSEESPPGSSNGVASSGNSLSDTDGSGASRGSTGADDGGNTSNGGSIGVGGAHIMECGLVDCPDCPFGLWADLDGCVTCACAPPPLMFGSWQEHDMVFDVEQSATLGGIDRLRFDFVWLGDIAGGAPPASFELTLRVVVDGSFPSDDNATRWIPDDLVQNGGPIEVGTGTLTPQFGEAIAFTILEGYLSLRSNGGRYEGGIYLEMSGLDQESTLLTVAAPFDVEAEEPF